MELEARTLVEGEAEGEVVVLSEPLSFWGGFDAETGNVVDARHPQCGVSLAGKIVVLPSGRGSSSSSSVLTEAIRVGTAPAALILGEPDAIMAVGALVGAELYDIHLPLISVDERAYSTLTHAERARIDARGTTALVSVE